jgi:TRAP-type C4-dicarboxylate transport system substrate-binding protein
MTTLYTATFNVVTDDIETAYANVIVTLESRVVIVSPNWHPTMADNVYVVSVRFWSAGDNEAKAIIHEAMHATGKPVDTLSVKANAGSRRRVIV